jgi:hypothetical protein
MNRFVARVRGEEERRMCAQPGLGKCQWRLVEGPLPPPSALIIGWARADPLQGTPWVPRVLTAAPAGDHWLGAAFVAELDGLCCMTRGGSMVRVDAEGLGEELVGDIPTGIVAAAWSPDQGMVAVLTGGGALLAMTPTWQVRTLVVVACRRAVLGGKRVDAETCRGCRLPAVIWPLPLCLGARTAVDGVGGGWCVCVLRWGLE